MKRTRIKPPASSVEAGFNDAWNTLSIAISHIYNKNASSLSFEELYRNAYNLVLRKQGSRLYEGVKELISLHLNQKLVLLNPLFLKQLIAQWDDHVTCLLMLRDILMYMDRLYVKNANLPLTYDLGLELFRDIIFKQTKTQLVSMILENILAERKAEVIDRMLMKKVVDMMLSLDSHRDKAECQSVYHLDFEPHFLKTSEAFYLAEGQNFLRENDTLEFLIRIEKRLLEEKLRCESYLSVTTEQKLIKILENSLIRAHVTSMIEMENSGLIPMIQNEKYDSLHLMYRILARVDTGHGEMRSGMRIYIKSLIRNINELHYKSTVDADAAKSSNSNPIKWVQCVLDVMDKFDLILRTSLDNDKTFLNIINDAIQEATNENYRSPEYLSLFIDYILKSGMKDKSELETDLLLEKTILLFRLLHEKDMFERYYKQHLAKRLLLNKSSSEDLERTFVGRLKVECGCQFTSKLEGMFKDMGTSQEVNQDFKSRHPTANLSVQVLSSAFWPMTGPAARYVLPEGADSARDTFKAFYDSKFHGRRLTWLLNMGTFDIKASYGKVKKEINISTFGSSILMLVFNGAYPDATFVSFDQIQERTEISERDLRKTLQSLSQGKYKLLLRKGDNSLKEISSTDSFCLDINFTTPLARIKISNISSGSSNASSTKASSTAENDAERKETMGKIEELRKHQIEAAIVRIMKSRKRLDHNLLVQEVLQQLGARFKPSVKGIKQRIEGLIDREYLERDPDDLNIFKYLA